MGHKAITQEKAPATVTSQLPSLGTLGPVLFQNTVYLTSRAATWNYFPPPFPTSYISLVPFHITRPPQGPRLSTAYVMVLTTSSLPNLAPL